MIYFWPTEDGGFTMVTDLEEREQARLGDILERMEPGSTLGCMLDSIQIAARQAGLFQWGTDLPDRPGPGGMPQSIFPYGPFCVPAPQALEQEALRREVAATWAPALIVVTPHGPCCSPLPRGERGRIEKAGLRRRAR